MARQVEGDHPAIRRQRLVVEQPVVQVAAEAVHQHQRRAAFATVEVADAAAIQLDLLRRRAGCFPILATGNELGLEALDHRVDLRFAGFALDHHGEQRAHRQGFVLLADDASQGAGEGRLDAAGDLVGLHVHHRFAFLDGIALPLQPVVDPPLGHRQAPLGHGQGMDLAHATFLPSTAFSTAASIFAALGM
ncbi:hypothetical protein D3C78_1212990 [compost metagenome]